MYTVYYDKGDFYLLLNTVDVWDKIAAAIGSRKATAWRFLLRSFLLSQLMQALNFTAYVMNRTINIGIYVDVSKRVEELDDGFRFVVEARITDVDFKKVKKNWRKIYWYLRSIDHYMWNKIDPAVRQIVKDTFAEVVKEDIDESISEFRVVREEIVDDQQS